MIVIKVWLYTEHREHLECVNAKKWINNAEWMQKLESDCLIEQIKKVIRMTPHLQLMIVMK